MSDTYFENHGKKWTTDQDATLTNYFSTSGTLEEMCTDLKRTSQGIVGRLKTLKLIPPDVNYEDYIHGWEAYHSSEEWMKKESDMKKSLIERRKNKAVDDTNPKITEMYNDIQLIKVTMTSILKELQNLRKDLYE